MKTKLLVSFSGGETSGFMAQYLWRHKQDEYEMVFVFANTGDENEETLEFVKKCSDHFGFPVVWVEAKVYHGERKSTGHYLSSYSSADRNGDTFEEVVKKYGIPNPAMMHCSRELKERPITDYAKSIGWEDYETAIGIRVDEFDRVSKDRCQLHLIYPLVSMIQMTKPKINFWWSRQPFRLNLKGWEGNCKACWKKSEKKLFTIAREHPERFEVFRRLEKKYENYIPATRLKLIEERGETPIYPVRFFRGNRSVDEIIEQSKGWTGTVEDDSKTQYNPTLFDGDIDGESCEVFTKCE